MCSRSWPGWRPLRDPRALPGGRGMAGVFGRRRQRSSHPPGLARGRLRDRRVLHGRARPVPSRRAARGHGRVGCLRRPRRARGLVGARPGRGQRGAARARPSAGAAGEDQGGRHLRGGRDRADTERPTPAPAAAAVRPQATRRHRATRPPVRRPPSQSVRPVPPRPAEQRTDPVRDPRRRVGFGQEGAAGSTTARPRSRARLDRGGHQLPARPEGAVPGDPRGSEAGHRPREGPRPRLGRRPDPPGGHRRLRGWSPHRTRRPHRRRSSLAARIRVRRLHRRRRRPLLRGLRLHRPGRPSRARRDGTVPRANGHVDEAPRRPRRLGCRVAHRAGPSRRAPDDDHRVRPRHARPHRGDP